MKELKEKYYDLFKKELGEYCAPFWLNNGFDKANGGVINCLDREGKIFSNDKSVWMQGRCLYMYSVLYNEFKKDPKYLEMAKSCLDFMNKYCFDSDSRMYFKVTIDGKPLRKRRYWYSESFYVIGCAEYYKATGDKKALEDAKRIYDLMSGIYADPSTDPFKIFPKTYPETRSFKSHGEPMILLNVSSIMREVDKERVELYNKNIDFYIAEIKNHVFDDLHALLENVSIDNKYVNDTADGRIVNPGHDMECSFFLLQEAIYRNDNELIELSEKIFIDAINRGWDNEFGGVFYFKDVENRPVEAYEHDMKLWWPHNEGMNASLLLYKVTGKEIYKNWFNKLADYTFKHFPDHEYGEWYGYLRRDGKPTEPACKGCTYKGPFHVMRSLNVMIKLLED